MNRQVPLTVVTGSCGAGKTTLMRHVLKHAKQRCIAAVGSKRNENIIGDFSDTMDHIVINCDDEANPGDCPPTAFGPCPAGVYREELGEALKGLHSSSSELEWTLVENQGRSPASTITNTLFRDADLDQEYVVDSIVAVLDAPKFWEEITEDKPNFAECSSTKHIAYADVVIVNKLDFVADDGDFESPAKRPRFSPLCTWWGGAMKFFEDSELSQQKLMRIHAHIEHVNPTAQILYTCFCAMDPDQLFLRKDFELDQVMQSLETAKMRSKHSTHPMSTPASPMVRRCAGMQLNVNSARNFIRDILCEDMGCQLSRFKGVFALKGTNLKFVFHGMHKTFYAGLLDYEFAEDGSDLECSFVLTGYDLKPRTDMIQRMFMECKAEEALRFKVGSLVMARVATGFQLAKVLKHWDNGSCYRLELQDLEKTNLWAPWDTDMVVRVRTRREMVSNRAAAAGA